MAKVRLASFDDLQRVDTDLLREQIDTGVTTETVFGGPRDPIHVRLHHLPDGEKLRWQQSGMGYLAFVWEGSVLAGREPLGPGSMIVVEHEASAEVAATGGTATLLVFNRREGGERPTKAGGHVHLLPADRVPRRRRMNGPVNYGAAIFADSACPTCELWLHETDFLDPDFTIAPHFHSEDEVIVVTKGEIVLGKRRYGRGSAVAVAKNTIYGFKTGPEGLAFINFRPSRPTYATPNSDRIIDEQALYLEKLGRPQYIEIA